MKLTKSFDKYCQFLTGVESKSSVKEIIRDSATLFSAFALFFLLMCIFG